MQLLIELRVTQAGFALASFLVSTALAQSSTYILNNVDSSSSNLTFALSIPANSSDFVFALTGPASRSWVAIGTGFKMAGSMMFVAYSNANGQSKKSGLQQQVTSSLTCGVDVTLSPRIATSNNEPQYSDTIDVSLLPGTGITNGTFLVNAHCRNCKTWNGGSLDFSSTNQNWIYGVGPSQSLKSDSTSATISQHSTYGNLPSNPTFLALTNNPPGQFNIDMLHATAQSSSIVVPTANFTSSGSTASASTTSTSVLVIHAALTVFGFLVLMPTGAFILRFMDSVRWHWVTQLLASIIAIVGGVIGFSVANTYYDSRKQAGGHKGIGIVVLIATAVQVLIGWWHHMVFKRKGQGTFFGPVHRYFGWVVMAAGIANAGIGLDLVVSTTGVVVYIVIAYIFLVTVFVSVMVIKWRKARAKNFPEIRHGVEGNYAPSSANSIPLEHYEQPARPYEQR